MSDNSESAPRAYRLNKSELTIPFSRCKIDSANGEKVVVSGIVIGLLSLAIRPIRKFGFYLLGLTIGSFLGLISAFFLAVFIIGPICHFAQFLTTHLHNVLPQEVVSLLCNGVRKIAGIISETGFVAGTIGGYLFVRWRIRKGKKQTQNLPGKEPE